MKRYCFSCMRRTEHIGDYNSQVCKRCGRLASLGKINLSSGTIRMPKLTDKIHNRRMNI